MRSLQKKSVARQPKVAPVMFDVLNVSGKDYYILGERLSVDDAVKLIRKYSLNDEYYTPMMIPTDVPTSDDLAPLDDQEWRQVDLDLRHKRFSEAVAQLKINRNYDELYKRETYVKQLEDERDELRGKLREVLRQEAIDKAYLEECDKERKAAACLEELNRERKALELIS